MKWHTVRTPGARGCNRHFGEVSADEVFVHVPEPRYGLDQSVVDVVDDGLLRPVRELQLKHPKEHSWAGLWARSGGGLALFLRRAKR
jgi:hypothetical protein